MVTIKRIVFPTDFSSCADNAFRHALFLARHHGAELHIIHVMLMHRNEMLDPLHYLPNIDDVYQKLGENAVSRIQDMIDVGHANDIPVHKTVLRGLSIEETILEFIKDKPADLIVMGTHGNRGIRRFLLGNVAEKIVRLAPCSVFTIRESGHAEPLHAINRILVPIDFSDYSKQALFAATEIAEAYNAHIEVLHVIEKLHHPSLYIAGRSSLPHRTEEIQEAVTEEIKSMISHIGGPLDDSTITVVEGHPAREIVHIADEHDIDLIVIATHGLTGIRHFLLGSVTEKVVRFAGCPVFTVKGMEIIEHLREHEQESLGKQPIL
jgi:nucleotide-binding universal stress UspA family protein